MLEPRIREILPPGWTPARSDPWSTPFALRGPSLFQPGDDRRGSGGRACFARGGADAAHSQMRLLIAANATDRPVRSRGGCSFNDRALLVPGQTFTCKTMLVQALVEAGATYYSDEYAVLDDAGLVHPYPRPLSIRGSDGSPVASGARVPPAGSPPPPSVPRRRRS